MKRQLNKDEKRFTEKNLLIIETDLEYFTAMTRKSELNVEIAPVIYKKQLEMLKKESNQYKAQAEECSNAVKLLKDQLKNGVEMKDTPD